MAPTSHKSGSLKQKNKPHKGAKKKQASKPMSSRALHGSKNKVLNKMERRLLSKQKRMNSISQLKVTSVLRGSHEHPIMCLLLPLTPNVPVNLAQLLLKTCGSDVEVLENDVGPKLQDVTDLKLNSLNKYFTFISSHCDDLFGSLDLAQSVDWIIILVPSDVNQLDESSYQLLTSIYAQGFSNISFSVLSSNADMKDIKRYLETRFPIPESTIHPLNSSINALNLLRHIALSHDTSVASRKLKGVGHVRTCVLTNSAARYRSCLLADAISTTPKVDINETESSDMILCIHGRLRRAPLFLRPVFPQQTSEELTGPVVYLSGWGDFHLTSATWITSDGKECSWSVSNLKKSDAPDISIPSMDDFSDTDDDGEAHSRSSSLAHSIDDESDDNSLKHNKMTCLNDFDIDSQSVASHAARTMASTTASAFSATQLAKFRAARSEEMFPDEVETPVHMPARDRFTKYRSLLRFQSSKWPIEKDVLPRQYEHISYFKNYHRNRRTVIRYVENHLIKLDKENQQASQFIPQDVQVVLRFASVPLDTVNRILLYHSKCDASKALPPHPLIVWSLLPHEHHMSVCHFNMHRVTAALHSASDLAIVASAANTIAESNERMSFECCDSNPLELGEEASTQVERNDQLVRDALVKHRSIIDKRNRGKLSFDRENPSLPPEAEPIESKELMIFQAGIRRFITAPIYSTVSRTGEKGKYERFFSVTQSSVTATMYAPVMYAPTNVLQFRVRVTEDEDGTLSPPYMGELVATGSLESVDPNHLIIKRIFLSGHPYKIQKQQVVVRYMFFNPTDVEYFRSVQLQTKEGTVGHIKESVGTHGLMKCVFGRQLSSSDVVLMPLYKRVFPKYVYEADILRVFQNNGSATCTDKRNASEWFKSSDVLQLRKTSHPNYEVMDDETALFV